MFNPVSPSRARALRALVWQAVASVAAALAWLLVPAGGGRAAVAALAGGMTIVLAGWLSLRVALGRRVLDAGGALGRLLAGVLLKWCVVLLGLLLLIGLKLPPLPVLCSVVVTMLAYVLANAIPDKVHK